MKAIERMRARCDDVQAIHDKAGPYKDERGVRDLADFRALLDVAEAAKQLVRTEWDDETKSYGISLDVVDAAELQAALARLEASDE